MESCQQTSAPTETTGPFYQKAFDMVGVLPPCVNADAKVKILGGLVGEGGGTSSSGCEQINIMADSLNTLTEEITCRINKNKQVLTTDSELLNTVTLEGWTCTGKIVINIDQSNKADITVLSNFSAEDQSEITRHIQETGKKMFDNLQKSNTEALSTSDGSKNFQMSSTDSTTLTNDQSLNENIAEVFTKSRLRNEAILKDFKGSGCEVNIEQSNDIEMLVEGIMDTAIKHYASTDIVKEFESAFKNIQENEAKGQTFSNTTLIIIAVVVILVLVLGGLIYYRMRRTRGLARRVSGRGRRGSRAVKSGKGRARGNVSRPNTVQSGISQSKMAQGMSQGMSQSKMAQGMAQSGMAKGMSQSGLPNVDALSKEGLRSLTTGNTSGSIAKAALADRLLDAFFKKQGAN